MHKKRERAVLMPRVLNKESRRLEREAPEVRNLDDWEDEDHSLKGE